MPADFILALLVISSLLTMWKLGVFAAAPLRLAPPRTNRLTVWHILLVLWLFLVLEGAGGVLLGLKQPPGRPAALLWTHWAPLVADTFARLVVVVIMLLIARGRFDAAWPGLGLTGRGLPRGAAGGLIAYLLIAPPLYLTFFVASRLNEWLWHHRPPEHPLLQAMQAHPGAGPLAMLVFMACVSAPISEELFFRGMLQSFIFRLLAARRHGAGGGPVSRPAANPAHTHADARDETSVTNKLRPARAIATVTTLNPKPDTLNPQPVATVADRWLAIGLTALSFALAHYWISPGDGAWLPGLFLLGMGLGYIYERTGNMWADITMHAAFNGVAVTVVLLLHPAL